VGYSTPGYNICLLQMDGGGSGPITFRVGIRDKVLYIINSEEEVQFNGFEFDEDIWYHVVVQHSRSRVVARKASGRASLWVQGIKRDDVALAYPAAGSVPTIRLICNPKISHLVHENSSHSWQVGNVQVFDDTLLSEVDGMLAYFVSFC